MAAANWLRLGATDSSGGSACMERSVAYDAASARVAHILDGVCCHEHCAASGEMCVASCAAEEDTDCMCADTGNPLKGSFGIGTPGGWKAHLCSETDDERLCICARTGSVRSGSSGEHAPPAKAHAVAALEFFTSINAASAQLRQAGDVHVRRALEAAADPLCGQTLDFTEDEGNVQLMGAAADRLGRCGVVALRNVFDRNFLQEYREAFTDFVWKLHIGELDTQGRTSNGERFFMHRLHDGGSRHTSARWEMLLPRSFASYELIRARVIDGILSHFRVLGPRYVLHSLGAAIAEAGVAAQMWHADAPYPFEWGTAAGSDIPPYAVTMMVPLLNMSSEHGPTHFCIGSSHTHGAFPEAFFIKSEDPDFRSKAYHQMLKDNCNASTGLREVQFNLQFGDAVLFDYQTFHRGGHNRSPQTRALLYLTFSRPWFKDEGFDDTDGDVSDSDREVSACATAPLGSSAGSELSRLTSGQKSSLLRISRPSRFAEPFPAPNSSFMEYYRRQAENDGGSSQLEVLAGRGYLFPSWLDQEFSQPVDDGNELEDDHPPVLETHVKVQDCPATAVFTEPFEEDVFW
ncbi:hypothetical protein AB1Y20_010793 [Prymnesium parvum]|uniref:Phytanoyl-CoA dioxygenase n=1 Tax=Prymnesium parvum TaxID=97485 RepID=A0AB34IQB7_PRYPA